MMVSFCVRFLSGFPFSNYFEFFLHRAINSWVLIISPSIVLLLRTAWRAMNRLNIYKHTLFSLIWRNGYYFFILFLLHDGSHLIVDISSSGSSQRVFGSHEIFLSVNIGMKWLNPESFKSFSCFFFRRRQWLRFVQNYSHLTWPF